MVICSQIHGDFPLVSAKIGSNSPVLYIAIKVKCECFCQFDAYQTPLANQIGI